MEHRIIYTENYLLVVNDSEIKVDDTVYYTIYGEDEDGNIDKKPFEVDISTVREINSLNNIELTETSLIALPSECKKIIAHLPLNNSPILEGVDLLSPLEDEVEEFAMKYADGYSSEEAHASYIAFIDGYNKAKEKFAYTKEDMSKALYIMWFEAKDGLLTIEESKNKAIRCLQQPKLPIAFECEIEHKCWCMKPELGGCIECTKLFKTTTNSQGQTVWVGTYKY